MKNSKLTSVKILKSLYNDFKIMSINSDMTLQKFTNRSIYLYLNDKKFRNNIDENDALTISGSNL